MCGMARTTLTRTLALVAVAAAPGSLGAQTCPEGREPRPWLGIHTFHCQGGNCALPGINAIMIPEEPFSEGSGGTDWSFTVEPYLWEIDGAGPAAGKVHEGDVLVAVDGLPVTTWAAGHRLTEVRVGESVELTLRRDGRLHRERIVAGPTCRGFKASAGPATRPWDMERAPAEPVPPVLTPESPVVRLPGLGLVLVGSQEMSVGEDGRTTWWFRSFPTVAEVTPGGPAAAAGIRAGEQLAAVDGAALTTAPGATALVQSASGAKVTVMVRYDEGRRARGVVVNGGSR